jgi:sugar phosphate isomerase/epimerase
VEIHRGEHLWIEIGETVNHPILISTAAYDGYDLTVSLAEIAKLGFHRVELAFIEGYTNRFTEDVFSEANAKRITGILKEYALSCLSFSAHMDLSGDQAVDIFKRRMRFAKMLDAKHIISNAGPRERLDIFMKNMGKLAELADALDITIALENPGDGKKNIIDSGQDAPAVLREIGSTRVRLNYDFGNLISHCFEKLKPEEDYKHALPYTGHFHIKDVAPDETGWYFTEIGKGAVDYHTILKELAGLPEAIPLSLEIPLRITRAKDASARRADRRVDLKAIEQVMKGSLDFVRNALSS